VALDEALDRVLGEDVRSEHDVPNFDRALLDGWAVRSEDTHGASEQRPVRLRVAPVGVRIGALPERGLEAGEAMAIPTGGALPRGADAVVMVEHSELDVDGRDVEIRRAVTTGTAIAYAGTDIARGELVLGRGERLSSRETGVLAAIGCARVPVRRRPRVAILSTGDELVAPGEQVAPGQVFDSNATMLADAVREQGGVPVPLGIVGDDEQALGAAVRGALACAELVLMSGGTSKGPGDVNAAVLARVLEPPGIVVHGVALKPGKPICLAVSGRVPVVVLPGFPTSAIFTFHELVAPLLRALSGLGAASAPATINARLPFRCASDPGRTEYVMAHLVRDEHGGRLAYPVGKGSGSVTTWSHADGYFVVPERVERIDAGETVTVHPVSGGEVRQVDLVVIGSHCIGVDLLIARLRRDGLRTKVVAVGSEAGLRAAAAGACDVAPIHLLDPASGEYNAPLLPPGVGLVRGYRRRQGLVFRQGDERFEGAAGVAEAVRRAVAAGARMVNRNPGSGTRLLIDGMLGELRPEGYAVEVSSHTAVAAAIEQGRADFGVAIDAVIRGRPLGRLPLREEHYDFAMPAGRAERPAVQAFVALLRDEEIRDGLRNIGLVPW
jgi:putative molybdopterin biosynthesis protein